MSVQRGGARRLAGFAKAVLAGLAFVYLLLALLVLAIRFVVLPHVDDYREELFAALSRSAGIEITASRLSPAWESLHPAVEIEGLEIRPQGSAANARGLLIPKARGEFSWASLARLTPIFHRLVIEAPEIRVSRTGDLAFTVAGIPLDLANASDDSKALDYLMDQTSIEIRSASLAYKDERSAKTPEITLGDADFAFKRTLRGWAAGLQGKVALPGEATAPLDLRASISRKLLANNGDWRRWNGTLYASAGTLPLPRLFTALQVLPEVEKGNAGLSLWADFANSKITRATLRFEGSGLSVAASGRRFSLASAQGLLELDEKQGTTRLSSPGISLCLKSENCIPGITFSLTRNADDPGASSLEARVPVADLKLLSDSALEAAGKKPNFKVLRDMGLKGQLSDLRLLVKGPIEAPTDWSFQTDFRALSLNAIPDPDPEFPGIPGGENLSGHLWASPKEGVVQVSAANGSAAFPGIFEAKRLPFDKLSGTTFWKTEPRLALSFRDMHLENDDLKLAADAEWEDTGGAGTIRVAGRVKEGQAESVYRYMPVVAGKPIALWLEQALRGGSSTEALAEWRGPIEDFPYTGKTAGKGLFLVTGDLKNASLDFLPSGRKDRAGHWKAGEEWPLVTQGAGQMLFHGDRMVIAADSGMTNGVPVTDVTAEIPAMGEASPRGDLFIHGRARGNAQLMLDYTKKSPVSGWLEHFLDPARASGSASLELALQIPFNHPEETLVSGDIALEHNNVDLGNGIPELKDSAGRVYFTQDDYWSGELTAEVWGMRAMGRLSQREDGAAQVFATTHAGASAALPFVSDIPVMRVVLERISGEAPAEVNVVVVSDTTEVKVATDLKGIAVRLPGPLAKHSEEAWPSSFRWFSRKDGRVEVSARYGKAANGRALLAPPEKDYRPERIGIAIGEESVLPERGFSALATLRAIPVEPWQEELQSILDAAAKTSGEAAMDSLDPVKIRVKTRELIFKARTFPQITATVSRSLSGARVPVWQLALDSPNGRGSASYRPENGSNPASITADLDYLYVPEEGRRRFGRMFEETPAEHLPSMKVRIRKLMVDEMNLGDLQISARAGNTQAEHRVWQLDTFTVKNPGADLQASGRWVKSPAENFTEVKGSIVSKDGEKLMKSLALPADIVRGAAGKVDLSLRWKGSPQDFLAKNLEGTVKADLGGGQFLQVEPGIAGRFLSLLSMQSLIKRLTLDFKDVVGKGLAFNSIRMTGAIDRGVFSTEDLAVNCPAAAILISGTANFVTQRLDAGVVVLPNLHTEGPALALTLANPVLGVSSFLAQFALKKPLSYMLGAKYRASGPWGSLSFKKEPLFKVPPKADAESAP